MLCISIAFKLYVKINMNITGYFIFQMIGLPKIDPKLKISNSADSHSTLHQFASATIMSITTAKF